MKLLFPPAIVLIGCFCLVHFSSAQSFGPVRSYNPAAPAGGETAPAAGQPTQQPISIVPPGFELTPEQQARLDQILKYWEFRSDKIETFECRFRRWHYKPAFVKDPKDPFSIADGVLKYAKPDKGMFQVEQLRCYTLPRRADGSEIPGGKPFWELRDSMQSEYWVCDGKNIFEFVPAQKQVIERPLPPDQQGNAITDGPLPFLFGAKADRLKERYWIRELSPPEGQQEYWLQVKPKSRDDAVNFEMAEVVLDSKEYLPSALRLYLPGGQERQSFVFSDRSVNSIVTRMADWVNHNFYEPRTPAGWKRVQETPQPVGPRAAGPVAPAAVPTNRATWK